MQLIQFIQESEITSIEELQKRTIAVEDRSAWKNIGGQLMPEEKFEQFIEGIHKNVIGSWEAVHGFYKECGASYKHDKFHHAYASLLKIKGISPNSFTLPIFTDSLNEALATKEWMVKNIYNSRAKDYQSPFRKMVYDNDVEMDEVIGKLEDNTFIQQQQKELEQMRNNVEQLLKIFR